MTDAQREEFQRSSLRRALQKSEAARTALLIAILIVLMTVSLVRHWAHGVVMQGGMFAASMVVLGVAIAWAVGSALFVRYRDRRGEAIADSFWVFSAILESLLPSVAIFAFIRLASGDPIFHVTPPALLVYGILAVTSVMRLRPALSVIGGIVSAGTHVALVFYAVSRAGGAPLGVVVTMLSYSVMVLVAWLAAAVVAKELRKHVLAAVREATVRAELAEINNEMSVANEIQRRLMPAEPLRVADYEVCGWNRPASRTGGDYYDWMPLDEQRVAVAIADVTGHGIGPALLMAVCRAYARATLPGTLQLDGGLRKLNTLLTDDLGAGRFITLAAAIVNHQTHETELLSAGHGPLLLHRHHDSQVEVFGGDGFPLGIMPDPGFDATRKIIFAPGDVLLLVTDGFTEAAHPDTAEMYGLERLQQFLQTNANLPGGALLTALADDVGKFTLAAPQNDDMTAVLIRRRK